MTINKLIENLRKYENSYKELISKYSNVLPDEQYEKANKAIFERAPYKATQLFILLNQLKPNANFPDADVDYNLMMNTLVERENEISEISKLSKNENLYNITNEQILTTKNLDIFFKQIDSVSEIAYLNYLMARELK